MAHCFESTLLILFRSKTKSKCGTRKKCMKWNEMTKKCLLAFKEKSWILLMFSPSSIKGKYVKFMRLFEKNELYYQ